MLQDEHSTSRPEAKDPDTDQEEGQSNGSIAGQIKRSLRPMPSPQKESDTELEKGQHSGPVAASLVPLHLVAPATKVRKCQLQQPRIPRQTKTGVMVGSKSIKQTTAGRGKALQMIL
jgi:hypothetical protein